MGSHPHDLSLTLCCYLCKLFVTSRTACIQNRTRDSDSFHVLHVVTSQYQRANEMLGNHPQGNQEPLVVKDNVGRPQVSLEWSSLWNVILSHFSALAGQQKGHLACKKLSIGFLVVTMWLKLCTSYSSSCHHLHCPIKSNLPGLSWNMTIKRASCHRYHIWATNGRHDAERSLFSEY